MFAGVPTSNDEALRLFAFRHQHGEDSVIINVTLTRIAQEQANAMASRDDGLSPMPLTQPLSRTVNEAFARGT
jgi:hypothetical protein